MMNEDLWKNKGKIVEVSKHSGGGLRFSFTRDIPTITSAMSTDSILYFMHKIGMLNIEISESALLDIRHLILTEISDKWVNVEDKLPDEEDYYLVTDGYGRPWRDFYSPLTDQWLSQTRGISHWMPLPEPPTS